MIKLNVSIIVVYLGALASKVSYVSSAILDSFSFKGPLHPYMFQE